MRTMSLFCLAATCSPASAFVLVPSAHFTGTTATLTRAVQPRSSSLRMAAAGGGDGNSKGAWEAFTTDLAKKFAVAATIAAVTFAGPGDALAARSGGRMGGRSFSSSPVNFSLDGAQPEWDIVNHGGGQVAGGPYLAVALLCGGIRRRSSIIVLRSSIIRVVSPHDHLTCCVVSYATTQHRWVCQRSTSLASQSNDGACIMCVDWFAKRSRCDSTSSSHARCVLVLQVPYCCCCPTTTSTKDLYTELWQVAVAFFLRMIMSHTPRPFQSGISSSRVSLCDIVSRTSSSVRKSTPYLLRNLLLLSSGAIGNDDESFEALSNLFVVSVCNNISV